MFKFQIGSLEKLICGNDIKKPIQIATKRKLHDTK